MEDNHAINILKKFCNPDFYANDEDFKKTLVEVFSKQQLNEVRIFLQKIMSDTSVPTTKKLDKYFGIYRASEDSAQRLLDATYGAIIAVLAG